MQADYCYHADEVPVAVRQVQCEVQVVQFGAKFASDYRIGACFVDLDDVFQFVAVFD